MLILQTPLTLRLRLRLAFCTGITLQHAIAHHRHQPGGNWTISFASYRFFSPHHPPRTPRWWSSTRGLGTARKLSGSSSPRLHFVPINLALNSYCPSWQATISSSGSGFKNPRRQSLLRVPSDQWCENSLVKIFVGFVALPDLFNRQAMFFRLR